MLVAAGAASVVVGCHEPKDVPDENEDCVFDGQVPDEQPPADDAPITWLGSGAGDDFTAWEAGEIVTTVVGGQGSSMITPYIRLDETGFSERTCVNVRIDMLMAGGEEIVGGAWNAYSFDPLGDSLQAGPIYVPIDDPSQSDVILHVVIDGPDFQSILDLPVEIGS